MRILEIELELKEDNIDIELEINKKVNTGTNNYDDLYNKPQINKVSLEGNRSSKQLKLQDEMDSISNFEIEEILKK